MEIINADLLPIVTLNGVNPEVTHPDNGCVKFCDKCDKCTKNGPGTGGDRAQG